MSQPRALTGVAVIVLFLLSSAVSAADNKKGIEPADNPSSWKAEIRTQHDAIRALPATPKEPVIAAVKKLAAHGPDARPAIVALAADAALPEPHRVTSGIISGYFARFDVRALRAMAESNKNPFARREAIDLLAEIGGPQIKAFLDGLGKKDATLTAYIDKALALAPGAEAIREEDRGLLSDILLKSDEGKRRAGVVLVDRYQGKSSMDPWLESLTVSPVSDEDTQLYAAIVLVNIHKGSVPELKMLCARKKHPFVRYNAIVELSSKGPPGEVVLRELLAAPDEPLKKHIEATLAKK